MGTNEDKPITETIFESERIFTASRCRVWEAWSEADQLSQWWGPMGCSVEVPRLEFRLGGFFHYSMKYPGAPVMWGRFNYREIVEPERLVWLNSFSNERCGIARAPFSDVCPLEIQNTVTFSEHDGSTVMVLRAEPFGETDEERQFFNELCTSGSLEQGYGGTLNKLAEHLARD